MTQFALVPDGRLAYDVAGAGDPPMIFVHGWCCDRSHFAPQITRFSPGHAVATVDLRGHGESSAPDPGPSMAGRDNRNQAQATSGVRPPIAAAASSRAQRIRVTAVSG
jgi:pimeloyl-ACP methyl ester carboxylesterase